MKHDQTTIFDDWFESYKFIRNAQRDVGVFACSEEKTLATHVATISVISPILANEALKRNINAEGLLKLSGSVTDVIYADHRAWIDSKATVMELAAKHGDTIKADSISNVESPKRPGRPRDEEIKERNKRILQLYRQGRNASEIASELEPDFPRITANIARVVKSRDAQN